MKRSLAFVVIALVIGCKSGVGDRCQVNSDCKHGVCNETKGVCEGAGGGSNIDAEGPPDISVDSPVDAGADAMIDAVGVN